MAFVPTWEELATILVLALAITVTLVRAVTVSLVPSARVIARVFIPPVVLSVFIIQVVLLVIETFIMALKVATLRVTRLVVFVVGLLLIPLTVPCRVQLLLVTIFIIIAGLILKAGGYLEVLSMFKWLDAL